MNEETTDKNQFVDELLQLKKESYENISLVDYQHLRKIIWINRIFLLLGFSTAWIIPNPISMLFISFALTNMWCIVAHHVCHGGYNRIKGIPKKYHSQRFATGWSRFLHWPDWVYPAAWKHEHNVLHHLNTNESLDPDQISYRQKSSKLSQNNWLSRILSMLSWGLWVSLWKALYYAPNTIKAMNEKKNYSHIKNYVLYRREIILRCYLPYIVCHFIILPLLFFPLGWYAVLFVLLNRIGAEVITNWHTFLLIVPSHHGEDISLHNQHFNDRSEFYLMQIASTSNYHTGGFWRDYFSGYLNYQIEHHLFPDLPASQYVRLQPKIKRLCQRHGINYIQESIFKRIIKLYDVTQGKKRLKRGHLLLEGGCDEHQPL
ncbi:fatty acid desaturase family protein [Shewanella surugensis]|uniref:Fatty acid desaturase n=1 Tax=Shewanella surugensis TaxID=212020 RepID=A0ABT0LJ53_9GAMM|nr:fatty acid desaturase [Shewanella surugensis]MCL1127738.1 fatty acid desaturase [Shewanella surugensis]